MTSRFCSLLLLFVLTTNAVAADDALFHKVEHLMHSADAPRRSEGDFVQLKDGRILFIYTKFTGGRGDGAAAHLAGRESRDEGQTWSTEDRVVVPSVEAPNVMSVSLNRLADGRIALFYCRKGNEKECLPMVRFSSDEAATWSEPTSIIPDAERSYYVLNNDRVVQLKSGRLVAPVAQHKHRDDGKFEGRGIVVCYLSDDAGRTWRRGKTSHDGTQPDGSRITLQEPGVIERKDGSLLMFMRTNARSQFFSESTDGGETWSEPRPSPLKSPLSPASIERIPGTGHLLCIWNDHGDLPEGSKMADKRTPLRLGMSLDDGRTWHAVRTLEDDPQGWYCYTAIEFTDDSVLLAYCSSDLRTSQRLADTQIVRFKFKKLYEPQPLKK
jgi:hypothetical protein